MSVAASRLMVAMAERQKLAQLTSSVGAGVLGVGIGALAASTFRGLELVVIAVGLALHLWGMVENHRAEREAQQPRWATATYGLCWVALLALVAVLIFRAFD